MTYLEGLQKTTAHAVEIVGDAYYLPWPAAVGMAGLPQQSVRLFDGKPYLGFFGGAAVAIRQQIKHADAQHDLQQITWMPVMDENNAPIPCKSLTSRQVTDSLARCKAKAIAMCSGVGMSLFLGFGGDGGKARSALGVQRDTDLSNAKALTSINGNGNPYVSWSAAVAAARVTDPAFEWEVEESKVLDWHTGEVCTLPVLQVEDTYAVLLRCKYKGVSHDVALPIMDANHLPIKQPTVFDWNTAVMRALAKVIACASGYGLSVYAGEDLEAMTPAKTSKGSKVFWRAEQPDIISTEIKGADEQDGLTTELESLLPKDAEKRDRVFKACKARGLTERVPKSAADLVEMSRAAAAQVLTGLKAKKAAPSP